jgi:hypothetical protein
MKDEQGIIDTSRLLPASQGDVERELQVYGATRDGHFLIYFINVVSGKQPIFSKPECDG